ncbi:MAG TPA: C-type lectin domain-containing protein, partial [Polyangiaceae bacterium]|nr:C-type lectin domain-containing protein [Polyangiaceae bacterium]
PVSDHYYIDAGHSSAGSGAVDVNGAGTTSGAQTSGGSDTLPPGGNAQAGTAGTQSGSSSSGSGGADPAGGNPTGGNPTGGMAAAGSSGAGGTDPGQAGDTGAAGAPPCVPSAERCNGHDDNCNDVIDELACSGNLGCTGFTLSGSPNHGYMFCSSHKNWAQASDACAAQDMRLVALESAAENGEVAKKLDALTHDTDVTIGANDQFKEGHWIWDGGEQFWAGNQFGNPVNDAFADWVNGSPDNYLDEDCGVIHPTTGGWADRACAGTYAYLCEDRTP